MASDVDITVKVYNDRWHDVGHSEEWRQETDGVGEMVADEARRDAPKNTGAGAASIDSVPYLFPEGWGSQVSWDLAHYYMIFHEIGTVHVPEQRFLRDALEHTYTI